MPLFTHVIVAVATYAASATCPVAATAALPELPGEWRVLAINGLNRTRPDTTPGTASIQPDLQGCLLQERFVADAGAPPYESLVVWGANAANGAVQRLFAHSQHGRFGVYEGPRSGSMVTMRQQAAGPQLDSVVVEYLVEFTGRDAFTIAARLSNDSGRRWESLSRWEYRRRAQSQPVMQVAGSAFALSVADLAASEKWYTEKLGLTPWLRIPGRVVGLQGGGLMVELVHEDSAVALRSVLPRARDAGAVHGIFKAGVTVADFDATLAALRARGVDVAYGPYPKRPDQPANVIIRDNAGNLIQLFGR